YFRSVMKIAELVANRTRNSSEPMSLGAGSSSMQSSKEFSITASATLRSGQIRPFEAENIPQVADLHRRVFGLADRMSPELLESYRSYFTNVILNNPWRSESADSIVYEERSGRITGLWA